LLLLVCSCNEEQDHKQMGKVRFISWLGKPYSLHWDGYEWL